MRAHPASHDQLPRIRRSCRGHRPPPRARHAGRAADGARAGTRSGAWAALGSATGNLLWAPPRCWGDGGRGGLAGGLRRAQAARRRLPRLARPPGARRGARRGDCWPQGPGEPPRPPRAPSGAARDLANVKVGLLDGARPSVPRPRCQPVPAAAMVLTMALLALAGRRIRGPGRPAAAGAREATRIAARERARRRPVAGARGRPGRRPLGARPATV